MRLLKLIVALILLGVIALAGYAYFGDMEPRRTETRTPIAGPTTAPTPVASDSTAPAPAAAVPAAAAPAAPVTEPEGPPSE